MDEIVGFVGLGQMGWPIVGRLLQAGHRVIGHDLSEMHRDELVRRGGEWAASPRDVADRSDVVLVSLPTPASVEAVALGADGVIEGSRAKIYVDLSTTGPLAARRVADRMATKGITAIDAPVSGGVAGAEAGSLSVMLSGPGDATNAVKGLLQSFGSNVFDVGAEAGMGQMLKLINNLMSTTALAVTCEALTLGAKAGLDPATMLSVLKVSSGTNHAVEMKLPKYLMRGEPIGFSLDLSFKNMKLCVEAGEFGSTALDTSRRAFDYHKLMKSFAPGDTTRPLAESSCPPIRHSG